MKKNAFTLVELLAVIVIIGILAAISITIYTNSISESKKSLSDFQKNQLVEAARTYVAINTIGFNNIFNNMTTGSENSCIAISINVLITEGLIGKNVVDPADTTKDLNGYIKVKYDSSSSQYVYNYIDTTTCQYKYIVSNGKIMLSTES